MQIMPKTNRQSKQSIEKNKAEALLKRQIFLEEQVEFYKKHSNAKTLIIVFILLFLVLTCFYLSEFGNAWLNELRILFLSKGAVQAGF
jgi:hypothetical protein